METLRKSSSFKRMSNSYRLVIMNDDTFEEVVKFKLTRLSVYIAMSTIFVLLVGLTLAIISFTNLKFLIPGYGKQSSLRELRQLKMRTDSLEKTLSYQKAYLDGIQKVLKGEAQQLIKDTTLLPTQTITEEITD